MKIGKRRVAALMEKMGKEKEKRWGSAARGA
jgi:hypothetical protein